MPTLGIRGLNWAKSSMRHMHNPLVIGGTGGSGTRVVAKIVSLGGRYMGTELNGSEDAMPLARFDWRWGLHYLEFGLEAEMAQQFEAALTEHLAGKAAGAPWGWKHPHSYLLLPFLRERFPEMRFIQVVRDGRDIALGGNQQQACHYGRLLDRPDEPAELRSAAWWNWANNRAYETGKNMGNDYLLVRLEDLCADPIASVQRVADFSGGSGDVSPVEIVPPQSLGQWRRHDRVIMRQIEAICRDGLHRFGYMA